MAVSGRYTAVLDACVLYPRLVRDVLLSLAHADLYTARWSADIEREWTVARLRNNPGTEQGIEHALEQMRLAIPDCLITDYKDLTEGLALPDKDDCHVLAAAIRGHADAIVTVNVRHFPAEVLASYDIDLQTPDQFVLNQIMLQPARALTAIKNMRLRWERPQMSAADMVDLFERRELVATAAHLQDVVALI